MKIFFFIYIFFIFFFRFFFKVFFFFKKKPDEFVVHNDRFFFRELYTGVLKIKYKILSNKYINNDDKILFEKNLKKIYNHRYYGLKDNDNDNNNNDDVNKKTDNKFF